jgi:hypothetical protein
MLFVHWVQTAVCANGLRFQFGWRRFVRAVRQAAGHSGRCYYYIEMIHSQLSVDSALTHLWRTISGQ